MVLTHTARRSDCSVLLYFPYPQSDRELVHPEISEYTTPPEFYLNNTDIEQPMVRSLARVFYRNAKYLAKNKIMSVLSAVDA